MDMATKAINAYNTTYPDGYNEDTGITLYDHIEPRLGELGLAIVECPDEGCLCDDIVFTDGSRII